MQRLISILSEEYRKWKHVFWTCFVLNLLAYSGYLVHVIYAVDDYGHIESGVNHVAHGRWFADFIYNVLLQKSYLPTLAPVIAIVCYILSGIGLCRFWKITNKITAGFIVGLWSLHPYLLDVYNFRIATVNCAVVYILAIVSLLLVLKEKKAIILAIFLFYLALSTYQVVVGFAVAAIMVQVLLLCIRANFCKDTLVASKKLIFSYAIMLFCSGVLYLVLTKASFMVLNTDVNSRIQEGFIDNFEQFKAKLYIVATILFVRIGPVKEFVLPLTGKAVLFLIYLFGIATAFCKSNQGLTRTVALLWIFLIPIGALSFMLPLATHDMPWRICMGLVVFAAGMFALTQESDSRLIRRAGLILGGFLIGCFIFNNNTITYKQYLTNQKDLIMGNRIIAKIQSLENYQPDMELAIVGRIVTEDFSKEDKSNLDIIKEYTKLCTVRQYSLARSAFETDWSKYSFLLSYMDLELNYPRPQTIEKANAHSTGHKPWPDPSSVFIQDNIVVLVLSETDLPYSHSKNQKAESSRF